MWKFTQEVEEEEEEVEEAGRVAFRFWCSQRVAFSVSLVGRGLQLEFMAYGLWLMMVYWQS